MLVITLLACEQPSLPVDPPELGGLPRFVLEVAEDPDEDPYSNDWIPTTWDLVQGDTLRSGYAGVHVRGNSTREYDKKSYAFETRSADGDDADVAFFDMPEEEDWILRGPFSDKSLMRNALVYGWSRDIGRYAPRTQFTELVINDDYRGLYTFTEKIKQDAGRVDLDDGDFLLRHDWLYTDAPVIETSRCEDAVLVEWPKEPTNSQLEAARAQLDVVEAALASGDYGAVVDVDSFVDHMLLVELARNVDAYVLSTTMVLQDGVLRMGPVWDFNGALGNADYFEAWESEGWHYNNPEFPGDNPEAFCWWQMLLDDDAFRERRKERWREHRAGPLSDEALMASIDANAAQLRPAVDANFERWPVLGEYVWPNDEGAEDRESWEEELAYLKGWILARAEWMDARL